MNPSGKTTEGSGNTNGANKIVRSAGSFIINAPSKKIHQIMLRIDFFVVMVKKKRRKPRLFQE
jgi:hypothetical protein